VRRNKPNESEGDIPKVERYSQNTLSCIPPQVTNIFTARSLTITSAGVVQSATINVAPTWTFLLSDIDNFTSFTGLFDQYRIDCVRFIIRPNNNAIGLVTNSTTILVPMYCVIDYDNAAVLSTAAEARSYDNVMIVAPGESACRTFCPHAADALYAGAFTSFGNVKHPWIDSANPSVQHFGLKLFVPSGVAGQTLLQSWIVEREYFLSFRKISSGN